MNIFLLDYSPILAAQFQCDKHVVKLTLETAQILSTVSGGPYKPTHQNHPCVKWAASNAINYRWLHRHGMALCREYSFRYGRRHKCQDVIASLSQPPKHIPLVGCTPYVQCMPDEFHDPDPVQAYRKYYLGAKADFAHWTKREVPFWWSEK